MSIYMCSECDNMKDGDYDPCVEHPKGGGYCCEECASEIEEEIELEAELSKEYKSMKAEYNRENKKSYPGQDEVRKGIAEALKRDKQADMENDGNDYL